MKDALWVFWHTELHVIFLSLNIYSLPGLGTIKVIGLVVCAVGKFCSLNLSMKEERGVTEQAVYTPLANENYRKWVRTYEARFLEIEAPEVGLFISQPCSKGFFYHL